MRFFLLSHLHCPRWWQPGGLYRAAAARWYANVHVPIFVEGLVLQLLLGRHVVGMNMIGAVCDFCEAWVCHSRSVLFFLHSSGTSFDLTLAQARASLRTHVLALYATEMTSWSVSSAIAAYGSMAEGCSGSEFLSYICICITLELRHL